MIKPMMIVLPKKAAYEYKKDKEKHIIDNALNRWVQIADKNGYAVKCFAEDFLAVKLLGDNPAICWLSVLGESDGHFLDGSMTDVPDNYGKLSKKRICESILKETAKKIKIPRYDRTIVESIYLADRERALFNRIRFACNRVLSEYKGVLVVLETGFEFCNCPTPVLNDSKLIIRVRCFEGVIMYYYSGVQINEVTAMQIIEGGQLWY